MKAAINRRSFLTSAAFGTGALLTGCGDSGKPLQWFKNPASGSKNPASGSKNPASGSKNPASGSKNPASGSKDGLLLPENEWNIPSELSDKADDGKDLKVALIGCGNRGTGAALDMLNAADGVSITVLADLFADRLETARKTLKEKRNQQISDNRCFTGFDSYLKAIDTDVDLVILATPPAFRPQHFKASVEAGKHVFFEKPAAVDPVGARSVIASSKIALNKGLAVITGTQRHHQRSYIESYKHIQRGLIGNIVAARIYWNTGKHWLKYKQKEWTDIEWMIRDWGNWTWLSGDHIVEQHVHNIDVINWFTGSHPIRATAMGAHQRRATGDQYDMFAVDYVYPSGMHTSSMSRQIDGCSNNISEHLVGTKGTWQNNGVIKDHAGNVLWKYDKEKEKQEFKQTNEFVLEHVNLINHIRHSKPISHAELTAVSSLTAIMGRISAYTGKDVTWQQMMQSDLNIVPNDLTLRNVDMKQYAFAVPGQ
ncbi:MAG: Gfo/Idh/MocA family oxidoreductase [Tannerella sp.]|jgi:predicted dehydrogenase|nr:Gfo/Idh/MocA family oxidoreductase [Tannerella sp.]